MNLLCVLVVVGIGFFRYWLFLGEESERLRMNELWRGGEEEKMDELGMDIWLHYEIKRRKEKGLMR